MFKKCLKYQKISVSDQILHTKKGAYFDYQHSSESKFDVAQDEKKKRKAQLQEANRKKKAKRIERKMAAVARDRAWAERLAELQQIEEDKKKASMT